MGKGKKKQFFSLAPILFLFVFVILGLSVVYSVSSSTLTVDGHAFVRPSKDIRITAVEVNSSTNGGTLNENLEFGVNTFYINGHVPPDLGANGNLIVDVTITNMSSSNILITGIQNTSFSNTNMNYEYLNIVPNETIVPAASSYTFQVKISFNRGVVETITKFLESILETLFGISTNVTSTFVVSWSGVKQYGYHVTATPSDAMILVKNGNTLIGSSDTGSIDLLVGEGSTISYSVTKVGYLPEYGTDVISGDVSHTVHLEEGATHKLTIQTTPSDANVVIKRGDTILIQSTGDQEILLSDMNPVTYIVSKDGYTTVTDTVYTDGEDKVINIVLEESVLDEVISNTSNNTAVTKTLEATTDGYYLFEVFGGRGGYGANYSTKDSEGFFGDGGYVYGIAHLNYGDTIYVSVGGNGSAGTSTTSETSGGSNGGGSSVAGGGGGGGYSAVAINANSITLANVLSDNVILIAGGGGGGGAKSTAIGDSGNGGAGGSFSTTQTVYDTGIIYNGNNGTVSNLGNTYLATGGSNIGGVCSNFGNNTSGSLLTGGTGYRRGGAGGAGFYGGAGGACPTIGGGTGGGGGSSYVSNSILAVSSSYETQLLGTNPSTTGGTVAIHYLGKTYQS